MGIIPNSERLTRKWVDFSGAEKNFKKIFFDFELDFLKKGFFVQALNSFLDAIELNKADLSKSTTKLESAGYITVERKPGYKNSFILTEKGRRGLVARK